MVLLSTSIDLWSTTNLTSTSSPGLDYTTDNLTPPSASIDDYIEKKIADKIQLYYVPLCVFFGILGNSVSFCVLVMTSLRKTTTCLYMATIACMDSLILVMDLIFYLNGMRQFNVYQNWACGLVNFLFYAFIHYDVLLLVSMTAERYVAVCFPLKAASLITTKKAIIVIVSLAVFSAAVNCHNIFTRALVSDHVSGQMICKWEGEMNELFLTKIYPWIDSTLYCFIPMTSMFVLNILIIWNLRKAAKNQRTLTTSLNVPGTRLKNIKTQGQRQITVMLMLVSFAFFLLASPVSILIIIQRYVWFPETPHELAVFKLMHAIIDNLMYTNHTINFLLYCVSGQKFRVELRRLCCRRHIQKQVSRFKGYSSRTFVCGSVDTTRATISTVSESLVCE